MQSKPMLYKCLATERGSSGSPTAGEFTDKITSLIYETPEECNEVKKNKRKERKNKRSSVTGRMQLWLSLTLESSKNFSDSSINIIHPALPDAKIFIAVTMAWLATALNCTLQNIGFQNHHYSIVKLQTIMNGPCQSCTVFGKLYHGTANNASMSHVPTE